MEKENIERLINDKSVTAYKIGKEAGVNASTIINIRNGKRVVSNLSQESMEKLNRYSLKLYYPERVFWDLEDKDKLLDLINKQPEKNWDVLIRESTTYDDTNNPVESDYPIEITVNTFDSESNELLEKYWDRYKYLINEVYPDRNFPTPLQPLYVDYAEVSFFNRKQMLSIIKRLRQFLASRSIDYANEFESEDEAVLTRTLDACPLKKTDSSSQLLLYLKPIPYPLSLASLY